MRHFSHPLLLAFALGWPAQFISAQPPNPKQVDFWHTIKMALQTTDGSDYFNSSVRDALLPGGAGAVHELRGTVVSSRPTKEPTEVLLAISDNNHAEVTLKFVDNRGQPSHYKGTIAQGMTVAFSGIARAFSNNPFMVTFEVELDDRFDSTFFVVIDALGSTPMPSISVIRPSRSNIRLLNVSLDDLPQHRVSIKGDGATTEMLGVLLEKVLAAAGWDIVSETSRWVVQVDGVQSTLLLPEVGRRSVSNRAWIVNSKSDSKTEASLVVVGADGTVVQRVDAIQEIRILQAH